MTLEKIISRDGLASDVPAAHCMQGYVYLVVSSPGCIRLFRKVNRSFIFAAADTSRGQAPSFSWQLPIPVQPRGAGWVPGGMRHAFPNVLVLGCGPVT